MTSAASKLVRCLRCNGSGETHFRHVENGVCFACDGTGVTESKPRPRPRSMPRDTAHHLRCWYRNAKLPAENPCHLAYEAVLSEDGCGWTRAGLDAALDEVPGSREAFRALGWPV
jgi:hypothetical protein